MFHRSQTPRYAAGLAVTELGQTRFPWPGRMSALGQSRPRHLARKSTKVCNSLKADKISRPSGCKASSSSSVTKEYDHARQCQFRATGTQADTLEQRMEKAEIMRVLNDEPAFSKMFLSHILARSARVEEDLVDQLFNSTEKRLARVLLLMANFGKEGRPEAKD